MTLITPSMPGRAHMLAQAVQSAARQEVAPDAHLIAVDYAQRGPAVVRNHLAMLAETEWLAFLDDDDVLLDHHLRVLLEACEDADVVYSLFRQEGRPECDLTLLHDCGLQTLFKRNSIPVTALVRTRVFWQAGGFPTDVRDEDWGLWKNLWLQGSPFRCVHEVTWVYRFHGKQRTPVAVPA